MAGEAREVVVQVKHKKNFGETKEIVGGGVVDLLLESEFF